MATFITRIWVALNAPKIFRFADLEIDEGRQRLLRNGKELPLPKLSFDLLLTLADSAPNFVSNKELMARVWPGLVIGDKTVSQRVKLTRDALGDDHDEPRYIAGLRGRGYCIAAPVKRIGPPTAESPTPTRRLPRWTAPGLAVVALVLFAWWLQNDSQDDSADTASNDVALTSEFAPKITVAVLPFRNLSGGDTDAYIALGIPEIVLDQLSTVPGYSVIARSSSFKAATKNLDLRDVGQRLGAQYLIDGSVQRTGDSLRVSAQLLDVEAGTQIWAERFDRDINEIFAIQDQIASQVAEALSARVATLEPATMHQEPAANIDAYLAYLRGRALLARWTVVDADAAARAFELAISLDPDFAAAYAYLYDARLMAEDRRSGAATPNLAQSRATGGEQRLNTVRTNNQSLIDKALALDDASGAAYFARAIWADDNSATREADFRRGLELDPSNGRGITAFAEFLDRTDLHAEAERLLRRAIRIDPLSPRAYFWRVMRNFPANADTIEAGMLGVLAIDPDYIPALQRYAKYRWMMHGDLALAIQLIEHALALDPANPWLLHTAVAMYLDIGDADAARTLQAMGERPDVAGELLIMLYDGDVRGAGQSALADAGFANGVYEAWGVFEALRDWSILTGEHSRVLEYIGEHTALLGTDVKVQLGNFRAVPAFADLEMASGDTDAARALLETCVRWIEDYHLPKLSGIYALRVKANAQLLLGETDRALDTLSESFSAHDYLQWWYTLEHDPHWELLRGDPRFQEITSAVQQHVTRQAALLEELRKQDLVPRRSPDS